LKALAEEGFVVHALRPSLLSLSLLVAVAACAQHSSQAATQSAAVRATVLARNPASANDGGRVYVKNCSSCHQADGGGVLGEFPPLDGDPVVTGEPSTVIAIVKLGMSGKIQVLGNDYDGTMPAWGQLISDDDIAAVVSYIRSSWHNTASPVSVSDVRTVTK